MILECIGGNVDYVHSKTLPVHKMELDDLAIELCRLGGAQNGTRVWGRLTDRA